MKKHNYTESEIKQLICEGDKRSYNGRLDRLKWLITIEHQEAFPAPALAFEYYEEAILCWYVGAFVSTIIMVQLAFEELLRTQYRVAKGIGGKLSCGKKVDNAGFFNLINEAKKEGWISNYEAKSLNNLRKKIRNPFVHVNDTKIKNNGKTDLKKPSFITQYLKIAAPNLIGSDVEEEAKEAIGLLVTLFPEISRRYY